MLFTTTVTTIVMWSCRLQGLEKKKHRQRHADEAQQGQNSCSRFPDTCPVVRMRTVSLFQNSEFYQSVFLNERSYLEKI